METEGLQYDEPLVSFVSEAEKQGRARLEAERREAALARARNPEPVDPAMAQRRRELVKQRLEIRAREKADSDRARLRVLRTVARHKYRRARTVSVPRGRTRCARPREVHAARTSKAGRGSPSKSEDGPAEPGESDAAYHLRGFLVFLIGFDWSEALIDSAHAFSLAIEQQIASGAS